MVTTSVLVRNTCSRRNVGAPFAPLIPTAIDTYRRVFADSLTAIYLMGSVPRGEAIVGESDIDFVGLVDGDPTATGLEELATQETTLAHAYPVVARVDLEAERLDTLSEFRRFVLASDSICVYGDTSLTQEYLDMERARLAELVTPDASALIEAYRAAVQRLDPVSNLNQIARYARVTGKDLLKCLRRVALLRGAPYEKSIGVIHQQVGLFAPVFGGLAGELYALYRQPRVEPSAILRVLDQAAAQLPAH